MTIKKMAAQIGEICDSALNHPNIVEDKESPETSVEDLRQDIEILMRSLSEIWQLAGRIYAQATD